MFRLQLKIPLYKVPSYFLLIYRIDFCIYIHTVLQHVQEKADENFNTNNTKMLNHNSIIIGPERLIRNLYKKLTIMF